jgi:hypothetical protein
MTPDAATASAVMSAIGEWDNYKSTTLVQIDSAPTGAPANIEIQQTTDASGNAGGCAAYKGTTGRIYYGENFLQAVRNGHGSQIIAHEFGHALGLADGGTNPQPPSVMNNPSNLLPGACTSPVTPTTTVQLTDASKIHTCTRQAKDYIAFQDLRTKKTSSTGAPYVNYKVQTCTYEYGTLNFYVDGNFDSSELYLMSIVCQ